MSNDFPEFSTPEVVAEEVIRLLEERLIVDRDKRKVGEIIVRKVVETRTVEVPVRREKLIVEQVSPEHKQLVEIDLGQGEVAGVELTHVAGLNGRPSVSGEFTSLRAASLLLDTIARQQSHGCKKVRIELDLEDSDHQATYQEWFDRCS
jgi:hypothetical protein